MSKKAAARQHDALWQYRKLGEILLSKEGLDPELIERALEEQQLTGEPLGRILVHRGSISEQQLAEAVAQQKHLPVVDLTSVAIDSLACSLISYETATEQGLLPISVSEDEVTVATVNPLNISAFDDLRVVTGLRVRPVVVTESGLRDAIAAHLENHDAFQELADLAEADYTDLPNGDTVTLSEDAPVVKLVNRVIMKAIESRASDIHIEPQEEEVLVRYRVDGVLRTDHRFGRRLLPALVSRIKVMSSMNIAERRVPQDGRCRMKIEGRTVDLRVSTLPSTFGESLNMRVVDAEGPLITLEELGMEEGMLKMFMGESAVSHGCVLVTGPTGSGKTTTLYGTINVLNEPIRKIITVEDPVEQTIEGITQIQIANKAGLTFALGLRSILRHDPDVVMVGEIRDLETSHIAIRAALTGHLVLSTLHTNDAASALTRLVDMGVEPFLVASAVRVVLAQRLARKLCPECMEPYNLSAEAFDRHGISGDADEVTFYRAKGCKHCGDTGYKGRIGVFELMVMNEDLAKLCLKRASAIEVKRAALNMGMSSLRSDGLQKALRGLTSVEEVMRVLA